MPSTTALQLVDGVRVVVPDSLDLITPYVLQEQEDWFEDEIKFVRRLLKPGQKVVDIGANYGVYTLCMAQAVGPTGRVWAFEPASSTAKLLAEGIAANGFGQVVLERSALSSTNGTAQLSLSEQSELNALVHGNPAASASETVPVLTLDEARKTHGWGDIDFLKIDAEGEEANILKGGERFFAELSPLVQYEVKAGAELHLELARTFAARGYDSYRLVPGLDLLAPFDPASKPDGFLLNLFCCKKDRAERLAAEGFLLEAASRLPAADSGMYHWRRTIAGLPYAAGLGEHWERTVAAGKSADVEAALSCHARSRDSASSPAERYGALETAFGLQKALCERQPSHLRLSTMARLAQEYGARSLAVSALQFLSNAILQHKSLDPTEPFLAPGRRFDAVAPRESIGNWVLAAVLEEFERLGSFSSFYTGVAARPRLEAIRALGFGSAEMERRLRLLQKRFGPPAP